MKRSRALVGLTAVTSALASTFLLGSAPAADAAGTVEVIAKGLAGPLQFDVDVTEEGGRAVVAESFAGLLTEIKEDGSRKVLHAEKGSEVAGVAIAGPDVAFLTTRNSHTKPAAFLKVLKQSGRVSKIVNLWDFEVENNPDGDQRYGLQGLAPSCRKQLPDGAGLRNYPGIVESHPYGLANAPDGGWYVADAAANAILEVAPDGTTRVVSVLKPQRHVVTAEQAEANGLPDCVAGKTFAFEPVPTDVEVDRDGQLVVSLLPGGPEDPSLGARGSVLRINPTTGRSTVVADGFAAATNVAVSGDNIYVTELFGGKISKISGDGSVTPFSERKTPAAVEAVPGFVLAAVDVFSKEGGRLVVMRDVGRVS